MAFLRVCNGIPRLFIGVITVILLCVYLAHGQETLATRMRVISEDLDRQLNEMMASQAVTYSTVNTTGLPYNASMKFWPKGMGQLYNVTNMFIDFVQEKQAYPEGESENQCIRASLDASRFETRDSSHSPGSIFRFWSDMVTPCERDVYENGRLLVGKHTVVKV